MQASVDKSQIISFNVGGYNYQTTLNTLEQVESNFLLILVKNVEPGKVNFIDRNGRLFEYVLDYLRDLGSWEPPSDQDLCRQLIREADFYLLPGMTAAIKSLESPNPYAELHQKFPRIIMALVHKRTANTIEFKPIAANDFPEKYIPDLILKADVEFTASNILKNINKLTEYGYELKMAYHIDFKNSIYYHFEVKL